MTPDAKPTTMREQAGPIMLNRIRRSATFKKSGSPKARVHYTRTEINDLVIQLGDSVQDTQGGGDLEIDVIWKVSDMARGGAGRAAAEKTAKSQKKSLTVDDKENLSQKQKEKAAKRKTSLVSDIAHGKRKRVPAVTIENVVAPKRVPKKTAAGAKAQPEEDDSDLNNDELVGVPIHSRIISNDSEDDLTASAPPPKKTKSGTARTNDEPSDVPSAISVDIPRKSNARSSQDNHKSDALGNKNQLPRENRKTPVVRQPPVRKSKAKKTVNRESRSSVAAQAADNNTETKSDAARRSSVEESDADMDINIRPEEAVSSDDGERVIVKGADVRRANENRNNGPKQREYMKPVVVEKKVDIPETNDYETLKAAFQELQDRYEALKNTGVKEAEERFEQYKKTAEARLKACEDYNERLKRDVERLREESQANTRVQKDLKKQLKTALADAAEAQEALARKEAEDTATKKAQQTKQQKEADAAAAGNASREEVDELQREVHELQQKEKTLLEQVDSLKKNATLLKSELQTAKQNITKLDQEAKSQGSQIQRLQQHDRYLITVERMVRIYEELTGVTIQSVEDVKRTVENETGENMKEQVVVYKCRQKGRGGVLDYNLMTPSDAPSSSSNSSNVMYTYQPILRNQHSSAADVPDWLQTPIEFEKDMCSMFFWRVCDYLQGQ
ncbi:hypothetical protein, variant [Spizellomyces punctatus DAOM BR117]|uniref:Monopolin complex subunit Csm1/Pcs1 C-terminal domain-containing protein n=1 Tax=Spizellomyces punctatus (strain DAOM BR117) TaxID=645134 RepID=A0A0L0HGB6_SPIPD|nr:hypothetical protein, variant [Spizellomyces punctatus DAOM BR117]KNC99868.1 hypothetical protein, variant [Spizellomyces punctatus DAOM BR117]|eukprot:XP_016607908.1 hypothetical protein, variant [Spizellomyces punctatus DAOM BR117]